VRQRRRSQKKASPFSFQKEAIMTTKDQSDLERRYEQHLMEEAEREAGLIPGERRPRVVGFRLVAGSPNTAARIRDLVYQLNHQQHEIGKLKEAVRELQAKLGFDHLIDEP
jgi:hypothetical protein